MPVDHANAARGRHYRGVQELFDALAGLLRALADDVDLLERGRELRGRAEGDILREPRLLLRRRQYFEHILHRHLHLHETGFGLDAILAQLPAVPRGVANAPEP